MMNPQTAADLTAQLYILSMFAALGLVFIAGAVISDLLARREETRPRRMRANRHARQMKESRKRIAARKADIRNNRDRMARVRFFA